MSDSDKTNIKNSIMFPIPPTFLTLTCKCETEFVNLLRSPGIVSQPGGIDSGAP